MTVVTVTKHGPDEKCPLTISFKLMIESSRVVEAHDLVDRKLCREYDSRGSGYSSLMTPEREN